MIYLLIMLILKKKCMIMLDLYWDSLGQRSIVNFGMIVETIYFLRRPRDFLPSLIKCRYEWFLDHEITVGTAIDFVFYCIVGNFDNDAEFEYALTQDDKGYLLKRIYEVFLSYNIDQILAVKQWITQEEASDMRLSKGAFNATTYRRIYYLINNVLKVR